MLNQKKLDTKMLDALTWKYFGAKTGTTPIDIPSGWHELLVYIGKDGSYTPYYVNETGYYNNGRFSSNNGQQTIVVTSTSVYMNIFYVGTNDNTSVANIKAYYR